MGKKIVYILVCVVFLLIIIISFTHSKNYIFNRTRFVFAGKETTINKVREKAYGFYGEQNVEEMIDSMGPFWEKIFSKKIVGENKKKEKEVVKGGKIFFDDDLCGKQCWVSKQASFFKPVFYYYAIYEYQSQYYVQMQFAINKNRTSYSSMFRFDNLSSEEVNILKEYGNDGIEGNGQKEIEERSKESSKAQDAINMNPKPPR